MPRGVSRGDEARLQGRLWTPDALRGRLVAWWSVAALGRLAGASGAVSTLSDLGYRAGTLAQSNASFRPALVQNGINGRPAADFVASSNHRLVGASPGVGSSAGWVAWWVGTMDGATPIYGRLLTSASPATDDDASGVTFFLRNGTNSEVTSLYSPAGFVPAVAVSLSTPMVLTLICDGTNAWLRLNGTAGSSTAWAPAIASTLQYMVGAYNPGTENGGRFDGLFGEAGVVSGYDVATVNRIEGYLSHAWGIALAAGHPYRNAPPLI